MTSLPRPDIPADLAEALALDFRDDDGEGLDFEPYAAFNTAEDTTHWIQAWTGNTDLTGHEYLIFGQDGTGGYAALWCVRAGADLMDQPVVFFGSEGAVGVVATSARAFLWLLADGVGPLEAVEYGATESLGGDFTGPFVELARRVAPDHEATAAEVLAAAKAQFPDFEEDVRALCR